MELFLKDSLMFDNNTLYPYSSKIIFQIQNGIIKALHKIRIWNPTQRQQTFTNSRFYDITL